MDPRTIKTTHKTGLRLISHKMTDAPAVSLHIFVKTGSRYEKDSEAGIAHFFEHMVFKGTPTRPSPYQISYELESIGAEVNAETGQEHTAYYIKVLKENLDKGAEILFDAFLNGLLLEEEVTKEREVIKEEFKMYEDDPSSFADLKSYEQLYKNDNFGRYVIGSFETLDLINSQAIKDFYKTHYFFENTVIVAVGNVEHSELEQLVDKYFDTSKYEHGNVVEDDFGGVNQNLQPQVFFKDIQQAQLRMTTYSANYFEKQKKYKISTCVGVLGAGMGSKLFIEVREKLGLAYAIYAYDWHWSKNGYVYIGAGLMPDKIDTVKQIVLQEIDKLAKGDFSEQDLNRSKELIKSSILMTMDTTDSWADFLGRKEAVYDEIENLDSIIQAVDQVSVDDVKDIMSELASANWYTTIVQPK